YQELGKNWKQWLEYLGSEQSFAVAFQIKAEPLGQRVLTKILPELQEQQTRSVAEAQARFTSRALWTKQVGLAHFFFSMLVSAAVAYVLARHITTRLADLKEGATAVAAMNLGHRIPVTSHDELGTVATAFNHMAENVSIAREHLTTANSEL